MAKPSARELKMALREAARMCETGEDPYFIAKTVLNQNFRIRQLETVLECASQHLQKCDAQEAGDELAQAIARATGTEYTPSDIPRTAAM